MSPTPPPSFPLQVLPLGVGGAFSRLDYPCVMLLRGGKTTCLIDCPDPIHRILRERATAKTLGRAVRAKHIDHLILTHLHGDHCAGLESYLLQRKFISDAPPPTIYALPEVAEALWPKRLAISMERSYIPEIFLDQTYTPEEFYQIRPVEPGAPVVIGDLEFEFHRTRHSIPTMGFRVSHNGRQFGYSCDTTYFPEYIEFLSSADVIFHDCNESVIHTPYADLLRIDKPTRDKIHILHFADGFDRQACELSLVEPGRLYTI